jgi:hypothetical protein
VVDATDIARARAVPIATLVAGLKLRRSGAELVGPCPVCNDGDDRLQIHTRKNVFFCRQCNPKGGGPIDFMMWLGRVSFPEAISIINRTPIEPRQQQPDADREKRQAEKANWLWRQASRAIDTVVEDYLQSRGIKLFPLPKTIRYLAPRGEHVHPAMVCAFGFVPEAEPGILGELADVDAIHVTLIAADGSGKAGTGRDKFIVGRPLGRPLVLAAPRDGYAALTICEGVEDALSAAQATGQGTWAAGGAGLMPALGDAVPEYFECATVVAHPDPAGQRGARALADRLIERGFPEVLTVGLTDG